MSTASRYRETVCGSRAGNRNAVSVPGVSGKTRGHYDPRALGQLGSRAKPTEPKCEPEHVTAASGAGANAPFPTLSSREPRLRQSPPLTLPRPPPANPAIIKETGDELPIQRTRRRACRLPHPVLPPQRLVTQCRCRSALRQDPPVRRRGARRTLGQTAAAVSHPWRRPRQA